MVKHSKKDFNVNSASKQLLQLSRKSTNASAGVNAQLKSI